jgi:hypothetical protein
VKVQRLLTALVLAPALMLGLQACAVVSVAGAAAGAAISVTSAVVSTGVKVTGKVIEKSIDAVSGGDAPAPEAAAGAAP